MPNQQKKYIQKKITFFALSGCLSMSAPALAGQSYALHGSALTTGPSSSEYSLHAASYNPAMSSLMVADDERWRVGYLPSITLNTELGDFSEFEKDLENLIDIIDNSAKATESVDATLKRFNGLLPAIGKQGYLKNTTSVYLPLFVKSDVLGGSLQAEFSYLLQLSGRVLDDTLLFNQQNNKFSTNTSVYLKSGLERSVNLGYSRPIFEKSGDDFLSGKLILGAKVSAIKLDLNKQVLWLEGLNNNDVSEIMQDEYDKNMTSTTGVNVDLGAVWDSNRYRLGLTLSNINNPSFDYNPVGVNCGKEVPGSIAANNCNVAEFFVKQKAKLRDREVHEMKPVAAVDVLFKLSKKWQLSSSIDLASYNDIVGYDNQYVHVATTYETNSFWIPSPRFGYTKNMVGEKLTSLSAGFTFFKILNLDVNYGQEETVADGNKAPRMLGVALSFDETF